MQSSVKQGLLLLLFVFSSCSIQHSQSSSGRENKFGGTGISVLIDSAKEYPYVVEVLSGKPGAMAGLRSGDYILAIDGKSTQHQPEKKVLQWLRGPIGSMVVLSIRRGRTEFDRTLKREEIRVSEQAGNLCFELEKVLISAIKNFDSLKGNEIVTSNKVNVWRSRVQLPGFEEAFIYDTAGQATVFSAIFYHNTDSVQTVMKMERLKRDLKDCYAYTCCPDFSEEVLRDDSQGKLIRYYFFSVRENRYPERIKELELLLDYRIEESAVRLSVRKRWKEG